MDKNDIIVVTGLPRSGTSLMMQILQSLGIELFTDNKRLPDESNPKGYFEHEFVKRLQFNSEWLKEAEGKAIKIVSTLLVYLPANFKYKIIFMKRDFDEIIQSQEKMLIDNNGPNSKIEPEILEQIFDKDLKQSRIWIQENSNCDSMEISYSKLINRSKSEIERIIEFLETGKEVGNAVNVIDKNLYRARGK